MTAAFCFLSPRHKQTMRSLQWQGSIFRDADVTERGRGADCQAWCRGPHKHVCCNRWMEGEWDNGVLCNLGWTAAGMLEVFFFGFFFVCVSYVCGSTGAAVKSPDTVRLPPQTLPSLSLFIFFSSSALIFWAERNSSSESPWITWHCIFFPQCNVNALSMLTVLGCCQEVVIFLHRVQKEIRIRLRDSCEDKVTKKNPLKMLCSSLANPASYLLQRGWTNLKVHFCEMLILKNFGNFSTLENFAVKPELST